MKQLRVISLVQRLVGGVRAEGMTGEGVGGSKGGSVESGACNRHQEAAAAGATGEVSNVCRYI